MYTSLFELKFRIIFTEVLQDSIRDISVIEPEWLHQLVPEYYEFGTVQSFGCPSFFCKSYAGCQIGYKNHKNHLHFIASHTHNVVKLSLHSGIPSQESSF